MVPKILLVAALMTVAFPYGTNPPATDEVDRFIDIVASRIGFVPGSCPTEVAAQTAQATARDLTGARTVCGQASRPRALAQVSHQAAFGLAAQGVAVLDLGPETVPPYQLADRIDLRPTTTLAGYRSWAYLISRHRVEVWLAAKTDDGSARPVVFRVAPLHMPFPTDFLAIDVRPSDPRSRARPARKSGHPACTATSPE